MPKRIFFLCIGGNLGDREENLEETRMFLEYNFGDIKSVSSVVESEAWGMTDAPAFLNQVIKIESELNDADLLLEIFELEEFYGRERSGSEYLSREMDIDVLFIDDEIISTEKLIVPHPKLALRKFVLMPLAEIAPDLIHPVMKKSILDLLDLCPDKSEVKKV